MDYYKLSEDILDLDSKIRFVCVCDGETRYDGQREGVNLLSPDESKKSNLQAMVIRLLLEGVGGCCAAAPDWHGQIHNGRV